MPSITPVIIAGGAGNDWIVGSKFDDRIEMGSGSDRVTGNEGVDEFIGDASSTGDTLFEARSGSFSLSDNQLTITYNRTEATESGTSVVQVTETETTVDVFESFILYGGASNDRFAVSDFTKNATLDGTFGSDEYTITLSGDISNASNVTPGWLEALKPIRAIRLNQKAAAVPPAICPPS